MYYTFAARQLSRQTSSRVSQISRRNPALLSKTAIPVARRMASTTSGPTAKSDAPWAIGSAVIFGSLFVYLTSPSKDGHGHHEKSHEKPAKKEAEAEPETESDSGSQEDAESNSGEGDKEQSEEGDNQKGEQEKSEDDGSKAADEQESATDDDPFENVKKVEEKPGDDAPAGAKVSRWDFATFH